MYFCLQLSYDVSYLYILKDEWKEYFVSSLTEARGKSLKKNP